MISVGLSSVGLGSVGVHKLGQAKAAEGLDDRGRRRLERQGATLLGRRARQRQQELHAGAVDLGHGRQVQAQGSPGRCTVQRREPAGVDAGRGGDRQFAVDAELQIVHCAARLQTQSRLTASISTEGWKGLVIQARAPAALPSAFLASCDSVVSMITGVNL
jgi:hypothetical protein